MTGFLLSGVFWGIVFILIGIGFIIKVVFNVDIHMGRLIFALIFIAIGLQIMLGGFGLKGKWSNNSNTTIFSECNIKTEPSGNNNDYQVIFGKGNIDLTGLSISNGICKAEVNTIFGESIVTINPDIPTLVQVNSAFGNAVLPDGNNISFGNYVYKTDNFSGKENYLEIKANVVFGSLVIEKKK